MSREINPLMGHWGAQLSRGQTGNVGRAQPSSLAAQEAARESHPQALVAGGLLLFCGLKVS